jgi:SAM-dependent methyltransferase
MEIPMPPQAPWYRRSGLASLDDLESEEWSRVFAELEEAQEGFLAHEASFRSPEYPWPTDALHSVSRPWEYAYVLSNLRDWRSSDAAPGRPTVLDFGSGVTFFPFLIAAEEADVIAVDVDPRVGKDLAAARECVSLAPGSLEFLLAHPGEGLELADASVDCAYSVSVLEHVEDRAGAIEELLRVLKPGGLLILTFDVCVTGGSDVSPEDFNLLVGQLRERFELVQPEQVVHSSRVLSAYNGPYPYDLFEFIESPWMRMVVRGRKLKRLLSGLPPAPVDYNYCGMVLRAPLERERVLESGSPRAELAR